MFVLGTAGAALTGKTHLPLVPPRCSSLARWRTAACAMAMTDPREMAPAQTLAAQYIRRIQLVCREKREGETDRRVFPYSDRIELLGLVGVGHRILGHRERPKIYSTPQSPASLSNLSTLI